MFRSTVIEAPGDVISLAAIKQHLNVEHTADDALIANYLKAAVSFVENYTNRKLGTQTVRIALDRFPTGRILLPFGKITAVKKVVYADSPTTTATLYGPTGDTPGTDYQESLLDDSNSFLAPAYGSSWPSVTGVVDAVQIDYVCGFGTDGDSPPTLPEELLSAVRVMTADLYERRASDDIEQNFANTGTDAARRLANPFMLPLWY